MIAIYADAQIYGGVQILIARFARYLASSEIPFVLIATEGTRISNELQWAPQIEPEKLSSSGISIEFVFFPHVCALKEELPWDAFRDSKIFCWLVHPTEIFSSFFPAVGALLDVLGYPASSWIKRALHSHNRSVCKLLQMLVSRDALAAMDGATRRGFHYFYPEVEGELTVIPLPCPANPTIGLSSSPKSATVSIGYLGRIDQIKASALIPFIRYDLSLLSKDYDIEMHFVAEGECLEQVLSECSVRKIIPHTYGFLPNEEARNLLRQKTDFSICMGTAALDMAAAGHPCVIIDPSLKRARTAQRLFRFVDEIEEFTVGEFRDFEGYNPGIHLLTEVIAMVRADHSLQQRGINYIQENHDPEVVFPMLVSAITGSTIRGKDLTALSKELNGSFSALDRLLRRLVPRFLINLVHPPIK